jgi:DNA sulfur modification protein DndE
MHYSKFKVSAEATSKLRSLRQRTGLRPNLLCRIALMLSLEEGSAAGRPVPPDDGMEFNRYTLTGEYDSLFVALLRLVEEDAGRRSPLSDQELLSLLRTHVHEGLGRLAVRAKKPSDIALLAAGAA